MLKKPGMGDAVTPDEDGSDDLSTWTLGAVKRRSLALEGYCETESCGRFYVFDLDALIAKAGADYRVPKILPNITCMHCGGDLKFMLAMNHPGEHE